ncbi:MAG: putative metal-binding motif-containing protein, partial [Myxococcota bacterium]
DPRVVAYRIYRDGTASASESEPHHLAVSLAPNGLQRFEVTAVDESGNESLASEELGVWTIEPTIRLSLPVSASEDDAEERILLGGAVSLTSTDLEMTEDQTRLQVVGIRFRDVGTPWQAEIRGAWIQFMAARADSDPTNLLIEGEASDDAPPFVQSNGDVSSRPRTSEGVSWEPPAWTSAGDWGSEQRTPQLRAVVQEIVDRPGWSPGNAMAFVVSGSGQRAALAYDAAAGGAAVLEMEYVEACTADADGDGFECATDCDDGDATVYPGALEVCDGRDNDCDNSVDESDASDAAQWFADFDGDGYGDASQSTRACSRPPAWVSDSSDCNDSDASAFPGASEACNGRDDDCDGTADEEYLSQSTSCGVGACGATGSTSCVDGSVVDSCLAGPPGPVDATCNGVDDDCDGFVDEEFPQEACVSDQPGVCDAGATACQAGAILCIPQAPAANDASCNGLDDDCDGSVDEEHISQATSCGVGACRAGGSTSCVAGVVLDGCEAGVAAPQDVTCDGVDDDCDGSTDEDYLPPPTSCGVGACSAEGTLECLAGALVDSCEPGTAALNDGICNGLDDDCDGSTDEDYVSQATSCGVGACRATGSSACVAAAVVDSCEAGMALPADATCDGVDDDCDGFVDEEFSPQSCATGQLGVCGSGVSSCQAGTPLCLPNETPAAIDALCNGLDDDCDGSTDEDYLAPPTSCGVGECSAEGALECLAGALVDSCEPGTAALNDGICNGLDDDCDGSIDEEYAPQSCGTGEPGICAAGTTRCESGGEQCQADRLAEAEVCDDGLDNDCDGAVDLLEDADCADCRERANGESCNDGDPETEAWCQAGECIAVPEPGAASGWLALALLAALARRRHPR